VDKGTTVDQRVSHPRVINEISIGTPQGAVAGIEFQRYFAHPLHGKLWWQEMIGAMNPGCLRTAHGYITMDHLSCSMNACIGSSSARHFNVSICNCR
jgi:hypothetical protein